jgi:predicted RecA/RadA family phage recombinase
MSAQAELVQGDASQYQDPSAHAALTAGEVICLPDGRAGVVPGVDNSAGSVASGGAVAYAVEGVFKVAKTASIVLLDGGPVYWDHSANKAHFKKVNDRDFFLGTAKGDAASAATTMEVSLNVKPVYAIDMARDPFDVELVLTAGTPNYLQQGGCGVLKFSATAEAQKIDMLSKDGFALAANAIVRAAVEIVDDGDAAALDFNIGVANATHASDADAITESVFIHTDGNVVNLLAESDDGTTEVAATDTTVDYTLGTRFEVWFDLRNPADVQIYIDGVLVLTGTTFDLSAATGPLKLLAHLEKTSDDTPGEIHIDWFNATLMDVDA